MIALPTGDDVRPLRLADLDEILARHLESRLDRLGAAADQIDVAQARGSVLNQPVGESLGGFGGEKGGMRLGKRVKLFAHGGEHVRMTMAEAGDGRAARRVEIAPAVGVDNLHA